MATTTAIQEQERPTCLETGNRQEDQEAFSFPVSSPSSFLESPRLLWRRVPTTANSSPTRLELLMRKYHQRRSFSYMETGSIQMMRIEDHVIQEYKDDGDMRRMSGDFNKMDLLWEDLHKLSKAKKYFDDSSDLDRVGCDGELGGHPKRRRPPGTVVILKVLKKLFYVRKTGSSRSC